MCVWCWSPVSLSRGGWADLVSGGFLDMVLGTSEVWSRDGVCVWCWSPVRSGPGMGSVYGAGHL